MGENLDQDQIQDLEQDGEDDENVQQAIIDEASPEQEDGESQNQFQASLQQKHQMMMQMQQNQGIQSNIMPIQGAGQGSNIADDLSTEQIIELL